MNVKSKVVILFLALAVVSVFGTSALAATTYNQKIPANVRIVQKDSTDNVRTFSSIQDAIDSITTASSSNKYLVKVMPGIYNEQVSISDYIDIEGSGEGNTIITSNVVDDGSGLATVVAGQNTVIRNISIENTASAPSAAKQAILFRDVNAKAEHVTVLSSDADDVYSRAILVDGTSNVEMNAVTIRTTSIAALDNIGLSVSSGTVTLTNSRIQASGGDWNPAIRSTGILSISDTVLESRNGNHNRTISHSSNVTISGSKIIASDGVSNTRAISGSSNISVMSSEVRATSSQGTVATLLSGPYYLAGSLVQGDISGSTATLVNCWDENFLPR